MQKLRLKIAQMRAQWGRLSVRERRMVSLLAGVAVALCFALVAYFTWSSLSTLADYNREAREALRDISLHRDEFLAARARMSSQEVRVSRVPLPISSLLETAAKEAGVQIAETTERPPAPKGKKYVEKGIDLKLRNLDLQGLSQFLKRIETGPNLLMVDRLYMKTRYNEHDKLEVVEVGVMTFEHAPGGGKGGGKKI